MNYRARQSKGPGAWVRDVRGAYTHDGELWCPGFFLYRGFVGCPAWAARKACSYCFLRHTFSGQRDPTLRDGVAWVDPCSTEAAEQSMLRECERKEREGGCAGCDELRVENARRAVRTWLSRPGDPRCAYLGDCEREAFDPQGDECLSCEDLGHTERLLNAGELADSLAFPPEENPHVAMLLDLFSDRETNPLGEMLLLLTKGGLTATKAHLEARQPSENVILSWSMGNAVAQEPYWGEPAFVAGPLDGIVDTRAQAVWWALAHGWRVRLRLDPLIDGAEQEWAKEVARFFGPVGGPELITLGALRHQGGRPSLPEGERIDRLVEARRGLRSGGYRGPVGLCKETKKVIRAVLRVGPEEMRCNCLP